MKKLFLSFSAALLMLAVMPRNALAGRFELAAGFSFSQSDYGNGDYQWSRRWTGSFGYHFSDRSEIELAIQDVVNRTSISGYEDTTFHDQIYSINWVQSLLGKDYLLDPYFKIGAGQLNRTASGTYYSLGGASPASEVDEITAILGLGLRIGITQVFGIRAEADTYLTGGNINTWKNNTSLLVGLSIYF